MIDCPFSMCSASVLPIIEQASAGDDEATLQRVPGHALGGHEEFGMCPASLLQLPVDDYARGQLADQAANIQRILDSRAGTAEPAGGGMAGNEHQLAPHPAPSHPFKSYAGTNLPTKSGGPNIPGRMPIIRMPLQSLPADGSNTIGGSALSSIGEVKGILARAGVLTAEAKDTIFAAEAKLAEALQLVNFVRAESIDPIGAPQLIEAIRHLGEAGQMLQMAIEANTTYRGTR